MMERWASKRMARQVQARLRQAAEAAGPERQVDLVDSTSPTSPMARPRPRRRPPADPRAAPGALRARAGSAPATSPASSPGGESPLENRERARALTQSISAPGDRSRAPDPLTSDRPGPGPGKKSGQEARPEATTGLDTRTRFELYVRALRGLGIPMPTCADTTLSDHRKSSK